MTDYCGGPEAIGESCVEFTEFMHYQYLPVKLAGNDEIRIPERLEFLRPLVDLAVDKEGKDGWYIYVTARHGWATADNPINRPGWHTDGFGTDDVNYIWWDGDGTRFTSQTFTDISDDHIVSMGQFEEQIDPTKVYTEVGGLLYRLIPVVVHSTPQIVTPHMRSFVKISFSEHRYNLQGNSHNYLFAYNWRMYSRDEVRNDPYMAESDFVLTNTRS